MPFFFVALALGVGFAFFVPLFFTAVAGMNASLGYPGLHSFLPKIFKIGFLFCIAVSSAGIVALAFFKEGRAESMVDIVTGLTLAWRFWHAARKGPIQTARDNARDVT